MSNIERWVTVCPEHGISHGHFPGPHNRGCHFWSTDDEHCRKSVDFIRLTDDRGAVDTLERMKQVTEWLVRDRREPDKVSAYAQELRILALRHTPGGQSEPRTVPRENGDPQ